MIVNSVAFGDGDLSVSKARLVFSVTKGLLSNARVLAETMFSLDLGTCFVNGHLCLVKAMTPEKAYHGPVPCFHIDLIKSVPYRMHKSVVDELLLSLNFVLLRLHKSAIENSCILR